MLPAILRPAIARPPAPRPTDALGAMLHGSHSWDAVQTPVSRTVTVASRLPLRLDVIAFFATIAVVGEVVLFLNIVTWQHNPFRPLFLAAFSTILMVTVAAYTCGLRGADLTWLRVWVGAAIVSLVAVAAMLTVTALLALVAIGIALLLGVLMAALD